MNPRTQPTQEQAELVLRRIEEQLGKHLQRPISEEVRKRAILELEAGKTLDDKTDARARLTGKVRW